MNFNEKQTQSIYEFIMKYNSEEEFRHNIQELYEHQIGQLSILQIYALEEILRYGTKGIFNKFLETKGNHTEEKAIELFESFIKLLNNDPSFKEYKMEQLKKYPETLSEIEKFVFTLISNSSKEKIHKEMTDELEYDSFNPILYATDKQIRKTLENLFFGEFIHQMLELPTMKSVKVRQKENGRIANIDKPLIIEKIQSIIFEQNYMSQFKQVIDSRYVKVKMDILLGKEENAFDEYLKYNTNISSNEILGIKKENTENDIYNYFMDMINKTREQNKNQQKNSILLTNQIFIFKYKILDLNSNIFFIKNIQFIFFML